MRKKIAMGLAIGAGLLATLASPASAATAAQASVTYQVCYEGGGSMSGYDATGVRHCVGGAQDGAVLSPDPLQAWCQDGYHLEFRYLSGLFCVPNVPAA
ncbi:hypothetical protein [Streptomyces corynorhini]|uniref:hypothetical protein n=1 Tax=Streptomyces corynorhini TaxID=2282652 RepID=UPI0013148FA4|nr:hypothetical protein [Streptomyces corynorhini]